MIKINSFRLFTIMCFAVSLLIVASCDKDDDDVTSTKVELLSFGPTGAKHGDTLRFIGHNLNKVTAIVFTGNNATVNQSDFKQQTSDLIRLIVPQSAEKGYVTLKTPEGDIVSKTQFNLDVLTTITSITPQARPGTDVTINGTYLNWVDRITFNRDKLVETFVSKTFNQIVVKVPDDAQTGPLILHYGGTDSADVQTADTLRVTLPVSTSLSPNPIKPLTNLTITGTDLDLAKKVIFTGVTAPVTAFVSQSPTQIVVAVPATARKGKLTLEAASGVQTSSANDLDIVLPVVTSFSPSPINLGAALTITGTDLDLVKKVIFSGVAPAVTTFTSQTTTQLVLNIPAGARKGKIKLEAASGVQTTSTADLDITLPTISSFAPNPVDPGTNLTINGTMLNMVTSVAFVNAPAVTSFVSQSPTQLVVTVPMGVLRGKITLGVSSPNDTIQSLTTLEIAGALPPPTIALPIYDDAVTANWTGTGGWVGGGWGGTADYNNTSPVRAGSKSVKINYTGQWGSPFQLGAGNVAIGTYTTFKISIFGAPGSAGKKVNIGINGTDAYTINVVEGVWTDYAIPISTLTGASSITEILIKEFTGGSFGGFMIYVDAIGLN